MIQKLADKAINYLKENYHLPKQGILAGGSLANLIWEYKSGVKAKINDIDIFIFDKKIDIKDTHKKNSQIKVDNITHPYEDMVKKNKDSFYQISNTEQHDIINYIMYSSNKETISNIISGFDFNCTQIGYDLKKEEFYWTKDFENFIITGELLCTNLQAPSHSILRLIKKCEDLNIHVPLSELELLKYANYYHLPDINKKYFSDKYYNYFIKYKDILSKHISINRAPYIEELLLENKKISMNIYFLKPLDKPHINETFYNSNDILFYWRNIKAFPEREVYWKFHKISDYNVNYFNTSLDLFDYNLLEEYYLYDKMNNLNGKTLQEQVEFLKKCEKKFDKNKIKIMLSSLNFKNINFNDEDDMLILELSCRKIFYNNNINNKNFNNFI